MEIVKKAWKVWVDNDEFNGYPYYGNIEELPTVHADSAGLAKKKCEFSYDHFTEIRSKRHKDDDIVMFEGHEMRYSSANQIIADRKKRAERMEKILQFPEDALFYVQCSHERYIGNSVNLWAINGKGYTINPDKAQKYTRQEIMTDFIEKDSDCTFWEASHFESKISKHVDAQYLDFAFAVR